MVRVQIFLDRSNFRPGKIDGLGGEFTQKAADRYCQANNLRLGTLLDISDISEPYREYAITEEDLQSRSIHRLLSHPSRKSSRRCFMRTYGSWWRRSFTVILILSTSSIPMFRIGELGAGTVLRVPDVAEFRIADVTALEKQIRERKQKWTKANEDGGESYDRIILPLLSPGREGDDWLPPPRHPRRLLLRPFVGCDCWVTNG